MALIELKSNLSKKIGKTNTTENGTFRVEQGDNTERTTQFSTDDVKLQYKKLRPDDDQFIKKDIDLKKNPVSKTYSNPFAGE